MPEKRYLKEVIETGEKYDYHILDKVLNMSKENVLEEVRKSQLVGRGGAGFPIAKKWEFVNGKRDVVLICNGDEGEPGTFKDRYILENQPGLLIEGLLTAAYVLDSKEIYIYIRGEYIEGYNSVKRELNHLGIVLDKFEEKCGIRPEISIVRGAGAYVCGDETSLINSIEGVRPNSRIKPPYPAEKGLFGKPTIVNNVETLSNIPLVVRDGGEFYSSIGVKGSTGTKLVSLSGKIKRPGVYEVEFGKITLKQIIDELGGGIKDNAALKLVIPGGISSRVLSLGEIDIPYDINSLIHAGSSIGSGAVIVADETVDALELADDVADFFMKETCGICFPCKEGNRQIFHLLQKIREGAGEERYLDLIKEISDTTTHTARCGLGQSAGNLISSTIEKFRGDYLSHIFLKGGEKR